MKTEIQDTELYKQFKKALDINDMRDNDNPYIVKCCEIAKAHAEKVAAQCYAEKEKNRFQKPGSLYDAAHTCCICGKNYVDSDNGFDTCYDCLSRI